MLSDLVRVKEVPPYFQNVLSLGAIGYVDDAKVEGNIDYFMFQQLTLDGKIIGWGWLPVYCLEPETSVEWLEAKNKHLAHLDAMRLEVENGHEAQSLMK